MFKIKRQEKRLYLPSLRSGRFAAYFDVICTFRAVTYFGIQVWILVFWFCWDLTTDRSGSGNQRLKSEFYLGFLRRFPIGDK